MRDSCRGDGRTRAVRRCDLISGMRDLMVRRRGSAVARGLAGLAAAAILLVATGGPAAADPDESDGPVPTDESTPYTGDTPNPGCAADGFDAHKSDSDQMVYASGQGAEGRVVLKVTDDRAYPHAVFMVRVEQNRVNVGRGDPVNINGPADQVTVRWSLDGGQWRPLHLGDYVRASTLFDLPNWTSPTVDLPVMNAGSTHSFRLWVAFGKSALPAHYLVDIGFFNPPCAWLIGKGSLEFSYYPFLMSGMAGSQNVPRRTPSTRPTSPPTTAVPTTQPPSTIPAAAPAPSSAPVASRGSVSPGMLAWLGGLVIVCLFAGREVIRWLRTRRPSPSAMDSPERSTRP
jgi:hypothetical protein